MKSATVKKAKTRTCATSPRSAGKTLKLSRNLTIYEAETIKAELLHGVSQRSVIDLDLSQVIEIDTAGIQLLMLAQRECRREGKALRVAACSPAVQELIDLYDLGELFGGAPALCAPDTASA